MHLQKLEGAVYLNVYPKIIQRVMTREGYTKYKACSKSFIGRATKEMQKKYSKEDLHGSIFYWHKYIYSNESSFNTSKSDFS